MRLLSDIPSPLPRFPAFFTNRLVCTGWYQRRQGLLTVLCCNRYIPNGTEPLTLGSYGQGTGEAARPGARCDPGQAAQGGVRGDLSAGISGRQPGHDPGQGRGDQG